MRTSLEERKKQYRIIYELLCKSTRIHIKDLAHILEIDPYTASRRLREAFEQGYISFPQVRKRSYAALKEYMYFVNCDHPFALYKKHSQDSSIVYHARMIGFANMWIIADKEINIEGDIIEKGLHSDYYVAYAPHHSWIRAIKNMQEKARAFDPKEYEPTGIIETHWHETIEWDIEDEILLREFKYNVRKKLSPIMKKNRISAEKIYKFFDRMHECCTVFTRYFPETISAYDPYLFMFETDYEDFIISLFSELPTSSFFFKVSDKLFLYANVDRSTLREIGLTMNDISQLHIPLLVDDLLRRGILEREEHGIVEYAWLKDL
jgi:predicted DNA-binding transcriptional regulator